MPIRKMALITALTTSMLVVACNDKQDHDSSDHVHDAGTDAKKGNTAGASNPTVY